MYLFKDLVDCLFELLDHTIEIVPINIKQIEYPIEEFEYSEKIKVSICLIPDI
jgi:hypothetical protein